MKRLLLSLIGIVTPPVDREWVLGDTLEEFERIERSAGRGAAHKWLRGEAWRVTLAAPRHRLSKRPSADRSIGAKGDGSISSMRQDLRYALRLLSNSPGFTAIAIVTLALGIGANTAMFAVVHAVLLRPLPFRDADRLMLVHLRGPDFERPGVYRDNVWSYLKYRTFLGAQDLFEDAALFSGRDFTLSGDGEPERVRGEVITDRYPAVLGIDLLRGRGFTGDEVHRAGGAPVAIISSALWVRRFAGDPAIVGRTIDINAIPHTIVGVLPHGFHGLSGDARLWVPLGTFEPSQLTWAFSHSYYLVARRKSEVTEQEAAAAAPVFGGRIAAAHPDSFSGPGGGTWSAAAASLYASRADADVRRASFVLLGAVGFVLLIACVNLTNLVGARAMRRQREVAVRVAIGASRGRIVRQFLAEGALLASLGAAAGLLLAWVLLQAASVLLPDSEVFFRTAMAPGAPRTSGAAGLTRIGAATIGLDGVTLLFTVAVAIGTALLVSLMPAVQASSVRPAETLNSSGRGSTARGFHMLGARGSLVAAQIALALVLLVGAGLMVKSAVRLQETAIGVRLDRVLTVRLDLPGASYDAKKGTSVLTQLVERIRATPGVESVAVGSCLPVSGGCSATTISFPAATRGESLVGIYWATPDYFDTLGVRLLRGRNFTARDRDGQPKVALVSETAARAFWPNQDPLGTTIAVGVGDFHQGAVVVGVVSDVRYRSIETAAVPDVYVPIAQSYQSRVRLFVRSDLDTRTLVTAIGQYVRALDPNLPLSGVKTMTDQVGDAMWRTRVSAWVLSAFAVLALLLTAIGIFGVMAQTVMQRTAEIGIRMALGAQCRDVLSLVLGGAAAVTAIGLLVGVGFALALTRLIGALLYGVEAHDPPTFVAVTALLGGVALAAGYLPARRAARVDAVVALRAE
jgi:predicted permease